MGFKRRKTTLNMVRWFTRYGADHSQKCRQTAPHRAFSKLQGCMPISSYHRTRVLVQCKTVSKNRKTLSVKAPFSLILRSNFCHVLRCKSLSQMPTNRLCYVLIHTPSLWAEEEYPDKCEQRGRLSCHPHWFICLLMLSCYHVACKQNSTFAFWISQVQVIFSLITLFLTHITVSQR